MSEKKIFFSYSRDDSHFVLNLAKELRAGGANVWLDQLDIKPGTRWDKSIEDALDASQTVLIVLSKTSVESNNVMDEVSYALEEGKTVLPILLEECDIPFRLRRLQFADFSVSHEKGIRKLTKALGWTEEAPTKTEPEDITPQETTEEPQKEKEIPKINPTSSPRTNSVKPTASRSSGPKKSKVPFYIIGGLILFLGVLFASGVFTNDGDEKAKNALVKRFEEADLTDAESLKSEMKLVSEKIKFIPNERFLEDDKVINVLVKLLNKYPDLKLSIKCHVHNQGTRIKNASLSKARALVLLNTLESKGISTSRISSQGLGESRAVVDNNTSEGRALNTRVELTLSKN